MMEILVSGGWFDSSGEGWIERIGPDCRDRVITFTPPEELCVDQKGFTGLVSIDKDLLVCGFNAIWRFDHSGRCKGRLHMPHFNDLHGLCVDERDGSLLVCNTGLDSVERLDESGRWLGRYALGPVHLERIRYDGDAIARDEFESVCTPGWGSEGAAEVHYAPPTGEYYDTEPGIPFHRRRVRDYLHPNHVVASRSYGPCVTLLMGASIRSLATFDDVFSVDGHPHDGIEADDGFWHTTVSGDVVRQTESGAEIVLSLRDGPMNGWCRGLVLGSDWGAVGVTALRGPNSLVPWLGGERSETKTGIVWFDRATGNTVGFADITDSRRGAKIFALIQDTR